MMLDAIKSTVEPTAGTWNAEVGCVWAYPAAEEFDGAAFIDRPTQILIASIHTQGTSNMDHPEIIANANIMAAAKELLAVAVEIEANEALSDALRKKARAAIRKAKGLHAQRKGSR